MKTTTIDITEKREWLKHIFPEYTWNDIIDLGFKEAKRLRSKQIYYELEAKCKGS